MAGGTADVWRSIFCFASLGGLAYALYASAETADPFELSAGEFAGSARATKTKKGACGDEGGEEVRVIPPQGPFLAASQSLSHALSQLSPLLVRVDGDGLDELGRVLEQMCASTAKSLRGEITSTRNLVEALVSKRALFSKLKALNRAARQKLPLEASDSSADFNAFVSAVNDSISNLEKDNSLALMGG